MGPASETCPPRRCRTPPAAQAVLPQAPRVGQVIARLTATGVSRDMSIQLVGPEAAGRVGGRLPSLKAEIHRPLENGRRPRSYSPKSRTSPGMRELGSGGVSKHLENVLCVWLHSKSFADINSIIITTRRNRCHDSFYPI